MNQIKNVAFLIYDDVTAMDFFGPFEVFSIANNQNYRALFNMYTVAVSPGPKLIRGELSINPQYDITNCPQPDILLIPGGYGARREMNNEELLDWIRNCAKNTELILTVCTGSLILAKTGLLKGMLATTHHAGIELLKTVDPDIAVIHKRFVDNGKYILAAGISAGVDMALYVVGRLAGNGQAMKTANSMEYDWKYHY